MRYTEIDRKRDVSILLDVAKRLGVDVSLRSIGPVQLADGILDGRELVLGIRSSFVHTLISLEDSGFPEAEVVFAPLSSLARESLLQDADGFTLGDPLPSPVFLGVSDEPSRLRAWWTPSRGRILEDLQDLKPSLSQVDMDRPSPRFDWSHLDLRGESDTPALLLEGLVRRGLEAAHLLAAG